MMLTGCSTKPTQIYTKIEYLEFPKELLIHPCSSVRHGDGSVNQLASAYVKNIGCIKKWENRMDSIENYVISIESRIKENKKEGAY